MDNLDQQLFETRNLSAFTNLEKKRKKNFDPDSIAHSPFSDRKIDKSLILKKDFNTCTNAAYGSDMFPPAYSTNTSERRNYSCKTPALEQTYLP